MICIHCHGQEIIVMITHVSLTATLWLSTCTCQLSRCSVSENREKSVSKHIVMCNIGV
jgi:hypothetical protein